MGLSLSSSDGDGGGMVSFCPSKSSQVVKSSQVKCIMNTTEFGDVRYKPNGYFEGGHHGSTQEP